MSVEVLLLSRDLSLLNVIRRVCDETNVSLQLSTDAPEAEDMLARRKFDGFIVDCDDVPDSGKVVQNLRKGSSNRSAVVFVIRSGSGISVRNAFEVGANFVLDKPVNIDRASRCIRAAHGLLVRERRRYFRVPVEIPVTLTFGDGNIIEAVIANLSEGGMSIRSPQAIPSRANAKVAFTLPDTNTKIEAKGEVSWTVDSADRGGIHFIYMTDAIQQELLIWLNTELQRVDPVLLMQANRGWGKRGSSAVF